MVSYTWRLQEGSRIHGHGWWRSGENTQNFPGLLVGCNLSASIGLVFCATGLGTPQKTLVFLQRVSALQFCVGKVAIWHPCQG